MPNGRRPDAVQRLGRALGGHLQQVPGLVPIGALDGGAAARVRRCAWSGVCGTRAGSGVKVYAVGSVPGAVEAEGEGAVSVTDADADGAGFGLAPVSPPDLHPPRVSIAASAPPHAYAIVNPRRMHAP